MPTVRRQQQLCQYLRLLISSLTWSSISSLANVHCTLLVVEVDKTIPSKYFLLSFVNLVSARIARFG